MLETKKTQNFDVEV